MVGRGGLQGFDGRIGGQVTAGRLQTFDKPVGVGIGQEGVLIGVQVEAPLVGVHPGLVGGGGRRVEDLPGPHAVQALDRVLAEFGDDAGATGVASQHGHVVPADLLDFGHHADSFTGNGGHDDQVDTGRTHAGHLARKINLARLVRGFCGQRHVFGRHGALDPTADQVTEGPLHIDPAHLLEVGVVVEQPGQPQVGGGVIVRDRGEQPRALARDLLQHGRGGPWRKVDHALVDGALDHRRIGARAEGVDHGKHFVLADQLVDRAHRLLRLAGVVFNDETDAPAVDAASLIDLVKTHLGAIAQLRHARSHRTRQVHVCANDDFLVADAGGLGRPGRGRCQQGCDGAAHPLTLVDFHGVSSRVAGEKNG